MYNKAYKKNIDSADFLVLPGVGSFPAGMKYIKNKIKLMKSLKNFQNLNKKKLWEYV